MIAVVKRAKEKRLERGLSIRSVARIIGASFSTLARLERGIGHPAPYIEERLWKWIDTDDGSAPHVRSQHTESWFAKMEQRVTMLEAEIAAIKAARPKE